MAYFHKLPCDRCKPGEPCFIARMEEAEERYEEAKDDVHDAFHLRRFKTSPNRPEGSWFDVSDPYPHTSSGLLLDDPMTDDAR